MTAVGTDYMGGRLVCPQPWAVRVPWACVRWPGVVWDRPESCLRGAVVAALGGHDAHVDYHQHVEDGQTRQTSPPACYRLWGKTPGVYLHGPRALDHLRELVGLEHIETRACGAPVVSSGEADVQVLGKRWQRYELRTPYFPSAVAWGRRPRAQGIERRAWAAQCLSSSIGRLLEELGLGLRQPVVVQLGGMEDQRVAFRDRRDGFVAHFVANVSLPPGLGLGAHRSIGFGEVQPCS